MPHPENDAFLRTAARDAENIAIIDDALRVGRINDEAAAYLKTMYSNGMDWFRDVFHFLGKCLGAPKAAVVPYDKTTNTGLQVPMKIADINPLESYLVQHRLDADPMRNQFFSAREQCQVDLSVSSIVSVIVGAQKDVNRAIDKITGKYYNEYLDAVLGVVQNVCYSKLDNRLLSNLESQIREQFAAQYITNAAGVVLDLVRGIDAELAVSLVRELDKIKKPYLRLYDVWRMKCLFDLVPQARTFIERTTELMPDRVLDIRDKFYDIKNPRNYRDAKIIVNIGKDGQIVPMEIICQVRKFFNAEIKTHKNYEDIRANDIDINTKEREASDFMEYGVQQYNLMILDCLNDLFERVGWNILYSRDHENSMFEGFPVINKLYYPSRVIESLRSKLVLAVENEIFHMRDVPAKLTKEQVVQIYLYMTRFILSAAMPYLRDDWSVPRDTDAGELFDFVMKEIQRYYKK